MASVSHFSSDTRTGQNPLGRDVDTHTPVGTVLLRRQVRQLLSCSASQKASMRESVVRRLKHARDFDAYVDVLLDACIASSEPDRLDQAVDVLARIGEKLFRHAQRRLIQDLQAWNPYFDRAYEPNDDVWYVLFRAVARTGEVPESSRLRFIGACQNAKRPGILEGVAEALGDLASPDAKMLLGQIATNYGDTFIRSLASDVLEDME